MYQIEKNIPLPNPKRSVGRPPVYPFRNMKVNDSFFVPANKRKALSVSMAKIHSAGRKKFTTRKFKSNGTAGYRCWRIK